MTDAAPVYLLDSNVCIYVLRDAHALAAKRLEECEPGTVVTSAIVYAEVLRGVEKHGEAALATLDAFFELVPVLPFDRAAGAAFLRVPFRRARVDRLIAAHALACGLTLVTNNEGDFADVPGLRVENWAAA